MASAAAIRRRQSANTAGIAAKQRRQTIVLVVLGVVLVALLVFQLPRLLGRSDSSSSGAVPAAPAASIPGAVSGQHGKPASGKGADPFATKALPNGDAHAVAAGGPDPFTASSAASSSSASPAALPQRIVIGRPGGHRVAKRGWIVILASIPTGNGRDAAVRFARGARRSVGAVSVLNSSNRRPLRGGYWVVYSGPQSTLAAVSRRAGDIHAAGYRTAYIRELVVYR
jgi:hypothetical protein